ncbi:hypothetical protein AC1031_004421 [Aphanomyces cochlioides]|nr:hypothetical protein AC1031_004421 [Aphanomyces cochlioides]
MQCSVDRAIDGVLPVVLSPNLTPETLAVALRGLATLPRRHSMTRVHLSQPFSKFTLDLFRELTLGLARVLAHCPHIDWDLSTVKDLPSLDLLAQVWLETFSTTQKLSLNLTRRKLTTSNCHSLGQLHPFLCGLRMDANEQVIPSLFSTGIVWSQLDSLELPRTFFPRYPQLLATFLQLIAPSQTNPALPALKRLSLESNSFTKVDIVHLASTLRFHQTLEHVSLAYSIPSLDIETALWLAYGLIKSPYSCISSLNLSGLPFQHEELTAMKHFHISHLLPEQGRPEASSPLGLHWIDQNSVDLSQSSTVCEIIGWIQNSAGVVLPGQGLVWLDEKYIRGSVPLSRAPASLRHLIVDDIRHQGLLAPLIDVFPAVNRLESLRVRRYGHTGAELHQVLTRCSGLLSLDIKSCRFMEIDGIIDVWRMQPLVHPLQRLNLCNNLIGATGAIHLADALCHSRLVDLNVSKNLIGDLGLAALDHALESNQVLVRLTIDDADGSAAQIQFLDLHDKRPLCVASLPTNVKYLFIGILHEKHRALGGLDHSMWTQLADPSILQRIFAFAASLIVRQVRLVH